MTREDIDPKRAVILLMEGTVPERLSELGFP